MGSIIAVASHKGGVGKTTAALNLAYSLSRFNERVLVLDGDPQGSLSVASNLRRRTGRGLVHALRGEASPLDIVVQSRTDALSFASLGVATADDALFVEEQARGGALTPMLVALAEPYDFLIIDAPAGVGAIVAAILAAADGVIMPVLPRALTLRTLPAFLKAVQHARRSGNAKLRIEGVIVTMFRRESASDARVLEEVRATFPEDVFLHTVIPADELFEEATLQSVPVAMLPGGHRPSREYLDLALELRERTHTKETDHATTPGLF